MHYAKRETLDSKGYILYDSGIDMIFSKRQNCRNRKHISGCHGIRVGKEGLTTKGISNKTVCVYENTKKVNFTVCKLYLNKK